MAKVLVHSQKLNKAGRISEFNGTTFGELLLQTTENGININDLYNPDEVEAVVNPGNITLRGTDSVLPQGDIKVFFTIKKNKAGSEDFEEALDDLKYDLEDEVDEFLQYQLDLVVEAGKVAMRNKIAELRGEVVYNQPQEELDEELEALKQEARNI